MDGRRRPSSDLIGETQRASHPADHHPVACARDGGGTRRPTAPGAARPGAHRRDARGRGLGGAGLQAGQPVRRHRRGRARAGDRRGSGRLRALRRPPGRRGHRGQEEGHHPLRRRVADGQVPDQRPRRAAVAASSTGTCPTATSRPATRPGSPVASTPSRPPGGCSGSTDPRPSIEVRSEATSTTGAGTLRARIPDMPPLDAGPGPAARRPVRGHHQPRAVAEGQPLPGADPDGDRVGQDLRRGEHLRAAHHATPRPSGSCSWSTGATSAGRRSRSSRASRCRARAGSSPSSTTCST